MAGREDLARRELDLVVTWAGGLGRVGEPRQAPITAHLIQFDVAVAERGGVDGAVECDDHVGRRRGKLGVRDRVNGDGGKGEQVPRFELFEPGEPLPDAEVSGSGESAHGKALAEDFMGHAG